MAGVILLGVFVVLLICGAPIAVCLGMSSVAAMLVQGAGKPIVAVMSVLPRICSASSSKFVLLAIPFFIISGNVMEKAGNGMTTARFCTSWATSDEAVNALIQDIEKL